MVQKLRQCAVVNLTYNDLAYLWSCIRKGLLPTMLPRLVYLAPQEMNKVCTFLYNIHHLSKYQEIEMLIRKNRYVQNIKSITKCKCLLCPFLPDPSGKRGTGGTGGKFIN